MRLQSLSALVLAAVTLQGVFLMASAQATAKAGALYIIESTNATFVNANTLVLTGASPTTTYRITYPYKDAGVLDTTSLVTDPIYAPKGAWLGGAIGTIFGNGPNATALLLVINGLPALDPKTSALTFNVSIISDPAYLKFSDGVARMTYNKQVTPNSFAKAVTVTAQVNPGATLTGAALFLDVDQTVIVPASAPVPAPAISAGGITNNNNNIGYGNNNNNNNNGGGGSITNNNDNTGGLNNNNSNGGNNNNNNGGITNNNNNGGNNNNNNGGGFTNNNNNGAGFTTTNNNGFGAGITNNNNNDGSGNINNNNNGGGGTPVPSTPGQTPAPGTYNVITTTSDCNGHTTVEYSYVPGLRGISRNNNNNCG